MEKQWWDHSPVAQQQRPEIENMSGFLASIIEQANDLRNKLDARPKDWRERMREWMLESHCPGCGKAGVVVGLDSVLRETFDAA